MRSFGNTCEHLKTPTVKCEQCNGTGKILDSKKIGWERRAARKTARIGLRQMATLLGLSASYIYDLEHGRRNWSPKRLIDYNAALDRAS